MLLYYYFCYIYLPNINHHMISLMRTELQHTQLLLRYGYCDPPMTMIVALHNIVSVAGGTHYIRMLHRFLSPKLFRPFEHCFLDKQSLKTCLPK